MKIRVLPYVTLEIDDRLRQRVRFRGERLRIAVRSRLRSAADDVETASDRVRMMCDSAVNRVDSAVERVNDRIAPPPAEPKPPAKPHLQVV
jgi:hypothetical protein